MPPTSPFLNLPLPPSSLKPPTVRQTHLQIPHWHTHCFAPLLGTLGKVLSVQTLGHFRIEMGRIGDFGRRHQRIGFEDSRKRPWRPERDYTAKCSVARNFVNSI